MKQPDIKASAIAAKFLKTNTHKLVRDVTSEEYHGMPGTWSSSQFKDLLDDEEIFIKKYIRREIAREEREAFDTGTYFHTGTLEPHKVASEIAIYPGKVRYGKEWDKWKAQNGGKCVITLKQKEQGDGMIKAVKGSPVAMEYLDGEAEVSLFVVLVIANGKIFAPHFKKVLTREGWANHPCENLKGGYQIIVKVRADCLGENYISDLKSTSGNARSESSVRGSISKYKYDLSAALYLDLFALVRPLVREFIWIFASKEGFSCGTWRASRNQILVGRAKYMKGMLKLADCARSNWEIVDCLREAEPLSHEMEWLREKDTDLL